MDRVCVFFDIPFVGMEKYKKHLFMKYFPYLIKANTTTTGIERTIDDGNQSTSPHSYQLCILCLLRLLFSR